MSACRELPSDEAANLIHNIKLGKIEGSHSIASNTITLFKQIITKSEWKSAEELMKVIRTEGRVILAALPAEAVVANITRRVLKLIREEYGSLHAQCHQSTDNTQASIHEEMQTSEAEPIQDYSKPQDGLRAAVLDRLQGLESELETSAEKLSSQAAEHIHSGEVILTIGYSRTVESFLKRAAEQRKFDVIVAECAPACRGHLLAVSLAKADIETTLISDASIFAMMSRVNKVIIGTHNVLADGGLRATCGSLIVALAAEFYSVPVIVLVPMYKFSPVHFCSSERNVINLLGNSEEVLPSSSSMARFTTVYNPLFDYVPPELVTLFISNSGGNAPSYVYRLLSELYHPDDYDL